MGGGGGGGETATCGEIRIKNGNEDLGGGVYLEPKYRGGGGMSTQKILGAMNKLKRWGGCFWCFS